MNLQFSFDSQEPVGTQTPHSERSCSQLNGHPQSQVECSRPNCSAERKGQMEVLLGMRSFLLQFVRPNNDLHNQLLNSYSAILKSVMILEGAEL